MKRTLLTTILAVLLCGAISAQQDSIPSNKKGERKKVAVVLSGGGAKGMAHIGALKVIEQAGIPIDIITGTSMGSIIGGLYAIGYNANSLDSMVRVQDWSYVITDKEKLTKQSLADRKKQNTYVFSRGITVGKTNYNDGGIIQGKNLGELFQQLCWGYTDSLDFSSDLPIPFACVATNVIDNSEYDFHSGWLSQAMRASMAIPAAFSPVRIGDMVLVDGGLRNNYPADIAREMGADIIIGVTVQGDPKIADDMGRTMSILSQIIDVNCKNKLEENLAITDLHVQVDTKGYNAASFSLTAIDTLIRRGEEEAMRHWDELLALKKLLGDSVQAVRLHPKNPTVMKDKHRVTAYIFENMTPQDERFLRHKFRMRKTVGTDIDSPRHLIDLSSPLKSDSIDADLQQQLTTTMRMDLFYQTAECRLEPDGNDVRVILTAGNRKTNQAYVGLRYDTEEHAAVQLGADFPIKAWTPMNVDVTLRLGKRMKARADLTMHTRSFTCPMFSYTFYRNDVDIYVKGDLDYNILYNQFQAELTPINLDLRHFNLQMGVRWDYLHYRNKLESEHSMNVKLDNEHFYSYRARVNYNSEDNWYFPTRGARFKAEYAYLTDNFAQLEGKAGMSDVSANWRKSFSFGNRFTLQPMAYGRMLLGAVTPPVFGNTVGGEWFGQYVEQQMPFAGIGNMEYVDHHFVAAQLQAQQRMGNNHYVLLRVAAAQQSDRLKELFDHRTLFGCQVAYYLNTIFGPLGASLGYSNRTKEPYLYLNLGYVF
ncbi:MAG: patatin-like phospholipase family protein [Prevotella sp.]|nr:patatin-like phospholipase family protein [Prevotella sp.]